MFYFHSVKKTFEFIVNIRYVWVAIHRREASWLLCRSLDFGIHLSFLFVASSIFFISFVFVLFYLPNKTSSHLFSHCEYGCLSLSFHFHLCCLCVVCFFLFILNFQNIFFNFEAMSFIRFHSWTVKYFVPFALLGRCVRHGRSDSQPSSQSVSEYIFSRFYYYFYFEILFITPKDTHTQTGARCLPTFRFAEQERRTSFWKKKKFSKRTTNFRILYLHAGIHT